MPVSSTASSNKTLPLVVVLSTLLFAALCAAGYFYYQYQQSPRVADAKEITELRDKVGQVFMLPEGEEPTLATVTDREKLADQPFFQRAENGDKVLIYSASGRAILYRPSAQKIVDVTAVNVNQPTESAAAPETPAVAAAETPAVATEPAVLGEATTALAETPVTVAFYNGSTAIGITNALASKLNVAFPEAAVTRRETAKKNDYAETLVVDVTGKQAAVAQAVATLLGGTVAPKPEGESDPGTDILIVVGNDQNQ